MSLFTVLAFHTPNASDHFHSAAEGIGEIGQILGGLEGGNHVAGLLAAVAVVAFLAMRGKSGSGEGSKSLIGGVPTWLVIGGLIAFVMFTGGGL